MTRIGGFWLSIVRTCTGLVWVRRSLRSPMRVGLEKERVVHLARRMAGREVELGEIIVVALDVRPFGDGKAHLGENGGDLVHHLADRMDAAGLDARQGDRQRDVERLALELRLERRPLEHRAPRRERFRDLILQRVDRRALRSCARPARACRAWRAARKSIPSCRARRRAPLRARSRRDALSIAASVSRSRAERSDMPWKLPARAARSSPVSAGTGPALALSPPSRSRAGRAIWRLQAAFGSAPFACSTIAANAAGSEMARSDSTLRSTSIPAVARPEINRL